MDKAHAISRSFRRVFETAPLSETFLSRNSSLLWYDLWSGAAQPVSAGEDGSAEPSANLFEASGVTVSATFLPFQRLY